MTQRMFFAPAPVRRCGGGLADVRPLLADEAERAVGFPLVLARLVDVDRDAGRDRLLDVGVDDAGDEVADDDRVGLLGDRGLHRARRGRLDVGLVDGDIGELDAEGLGRVLRPLIERGKERIVEGSGDEGDRKLLIFGEGGAARQDRAGQSRRAHPVSDTAKSSHAHDVPPTSRPAFAWTGRSFGAAVTRGGCRRGCIWGNLFVRHRQCDRIALSA